MAQKLILNTTAGRAGAETGLYRFDSPKLYGGLMYETENSSEMTEKHRWWLAKNGIVEGPVSQAQLSDDLKANRINTTTYVCPEGDQTWKPLSVWKEVKSLFNQSGQEFPPDPPVESYSIEPLFTNKRLPMLANWICIYAILFAPALWILSLISSFSGGFIFKENTDFEGAEAFLIFFFKMISFVITGCFLVGGLKLRTLKKSGTSLIMGAVAACFIINVLHFLCILLLMFSAKGTELAQSTVSEELISYFSSLIGVGELMFLIITFIWLRRNSQYLPLS